MFAVIRTGGKQYKVARDDVIVVEKLNGDEGSPLELKDVLAIGNGKDTTFGTPLVEGAAVSATVLEQTRADKIIVFKKKRRHNYRRKKGHRQALTVLRITEIRAGEKKKAAVTPEAKAKAPAKPKPKAAPAAKAKTAAKARPAKKKAEPRATKESEEKK